MEETEISSTGFDAACTNDHVLCDMYRQIEWEELAENGEFDHVKEIKFGGVSIANQIESITMTSTFDWEADILEIKFKEDYDLNPR